MCAVAIEPNEQQKSSEFAKLFEESTKTTELKEGEVVKGKVVAITRDSVVVDVGFKSEGRISIDEFLGAHGKIKAEVGSDVEVLIEEFEDEDGLLALSKEKADALKTWDRLEEVAEKNQEIEGTIISKVKGGLSVDIGIRAFLPGSQIDLRPIRNLDKFIGETCAFKIIKLNKRRGNVVLSRKAVLEKERESLRKETLATIQEGQVFDGIVKNVTDYGVFVDLGGIDGLLHITDMSWGRINHPSEMYKLGDDIRVVVLKFDAEGEKVSLGLKQLSEDPWGDVEGRFPVGSKVSGKVVSLADYGAFISLADGVEGLIHISEMSWSKKIKHPSKILNAGEEVEAIVLDIDKETRRISLGLKQIMANPWDELENNFSLGTKLKATVRNITDFGLFVDVGADIDGLVHISDLTWVQNFATPAEKFNKGDEFEVIVLQIDPENERFSLGLKQLQDDAWDIINKKYKLGTEAAGKIVAKNELGAIVELEKGVQGLVPADKLSADANVGDELQLRVSKTEPNERSFQLEPQA